MLLHMEGGEGVAGCGGIKIYLQGFQYPAAVIHEGKELLQAELIGLPSL